MGVQEKGLPLNEALQLARYISANDPEAFRELYLTYKDLVFATARRVVKNPSDAEDVAQKCFMEFTRKAPHLKAPLGGWFHRLSVQYSVDLVRNVSSRQKREANWSQRVSSEQGTSWDEISPRIDELLEQMPDELREPLVLHFLSGKSQAEVAENLGVDQATVSRRIKRGLEDLREKLGPAVLSIGILESLLLKNATESAPQSLATTLGKMAISGARLGHATGAIPLAAHSIGAAFMLKTIAAVALGLGIFMLGTAWGSRSQPAQPSVPISAPVANSLPANPAVAPEKTAPIAPPVPEKTALKDPVWQVVRAKYGTVHFATGYENDAEKMKVCLDQAVEACFNYFSFAAPEELWRGARFEVFLHPTINEKAMRLGWHSSFDIVDGISKIEVDFLAPSAPEAKGTENDPSPWCDHRWMLSQEAGYFVLSAIRTKSNGWKIEAAPAWYKWGYKHYLGYEVMHSHANSRDGYVKDLREHPERIDPQFDSQQQAGSGGPVLLLYLHEKYGIEKMRKLMQSTEPTFWKSFETELGITRETLYGDFYQWLTGKKAPEKVERGDF